MQYSKRLEMPDVGQSIARDGQDKHHAVDCDIRFDGGVGMVMQKTKPVKRNVAVMGMMCFQFAFRCCCVVLHDLLEEGCKDAPETQAKLTKLIEEVARGWHKDWMEFRKEVGPYDPAKEAMLKKAEDLVLDIWLNPKKIEGGDDK